MFLALIFFPLTCFDWETLTNNIILKQHLQILKDCSQIYFSQFIKKYVAPYLFTISHQAIPNAIFKTQIQLLLLVSSFIFLSYFYYLSGFSFGRNSTENNFCVTIQHAFFSKFSNFLSVPAYALLGKVHIKYINIFLFIISYMRKNFLRIIFFSKEEGLSNCKLNL